MITSLFELLETGTYDAGGIWSSGACGSPVATPIPFDPVTGVLNVNSFLPPNQVTEYIFSYTVTCNGNSTCTEVSLFLGNQSLSCPDPTTAGIEVEISTYTGNPSGAVAIGLLLNNLNLNTGDVISQIIVTENNTGTVAASQPNSGSNYILTNTINCFIDSGDPPFNGTDTLTVDVYYQMGQSCVCCHLVATINSTTVGDSFALTLSPLLVCPTVI